MLPHALTLREARRLEPSALVNDTAPWLVLTHMRRPTGVLEAPQRALCERLEAWREARLGACKLYSCSRAFIVCR